MTDRDAGAGNRDEKSEGDVRVFVFEPFCVCACVLCVPCVCAIGTIMLDIMSCVSSVSSVGSTRFLRVVSTFGEAISVNIEVAGRVGSLTDIGACVFVCVDIEDRDTERVCECECVSPFAGVFVLAAETKPEGKANGFCVVLVLCDVFGACDCACAECVVCFGGPVPLDNDVVGRVCVCVCVCACVLSGCLFLPCVCVCASRPSKSSTSMFPHNGSLFLCVCCACCPDTLTGRRSCAGCVVCACLHIAQQPRKNGY